MISPRLRAAVIASAAASGSIPEPLILDGITGAISEWDGENSAKTGNPITQWDDLIGTNHLTENHTSGTGAVPTTIGGRAALDFTPAQHYTSGIVMPAPSTGFTIGVVVRPHTLAANQIFIGRRGDATTSGGFSLWVATNSTYRAALSDGATITVAVQGSAAVNTIAIVQGGYSSSLTKVKVNGNTPTTAAHTKTGLGGQTDFGLGSIHETAAATNALDGDILFACCCTGLLSDADMATIAARLNARFSVF